MTAMCERIIQIWLQIMPPMNDGSMATRVNYICSVKKRIAALAVKTLDVQLLYLELTLDICRDKFNQGSMR
jgi:hypothetical protein